MAEKDFFNLINNAIFGRRWKMLENIKMSNSLTTKMIAKADQQAKFKPCFFLENVIKVLMSKMEMCLLKSTYVGMSILELSKMLIFAFHYKKCD